MRRQGPEQYTQFVIAVLRIWLIGADLYCEASSPIDTLSTLHIRLQQLVGIICKVYQCTFVDRPVEDKNHKNSTG